MRISLPMYVKRRSHELLNRENKSAPQALADDGGLPLQVASTHQDAACKSPSVSILLEHGPTPEKMHMILEMTSDKEDAHSIGAPEDHEFDDLSWGFSQVNIECEGTPDGWKKREFRFSRRQ